MIGKYSRFKNTKYCYRHVCMYGSVQNVYTTECIREFILSGLSARRNKKWKIKTSRVWCNQIYSKVKVDCRKYERKCVRANRRLSGRTSYHGARLKSDVVSHQAVEERRISPRGRRTSYLTGRFKTDATCRADEERRISPGGSRTTNLAARTKNDVSPARVKNAVSHRAVQERRISPRRRKRRISRVFFSWNFVVAALRACAARVCRRERRLPEYSFN